MTHSLSIQSHSILPQSENNVSTCKQYWAEFYLSYKRALNLHMGMQRVFPLQVYWKHRLVFNEKKEVLVGVYTSLRTPVESASA